MSGGWLRQMREKERNHGMGIGTAAAAVSITLAATLKEEKMREGE